ncbi:ubiquitin carboxyl-terminal hydrolase-like zinc finger-containing protein [Skeletonema marinoi]|uniref:Ubiquitin carboxyl-terminal hydrolase-like zinc finger-containing protein n=1 Tax=Skeletonema marinoi TaxID=267567 RepID=A0AAD8YCD4_9STRA|nr:ubiquitin carboxyl-terminal hydrolase-like zinc finger-containing protein [Skeletonema marinoi]
MTLYQTLLVCLNRIDPSKLGLPNLKPQHSCSRWCSSNTDGDDAINGQLHSCRNEILFIPWAPPSHCVTCQIISQKDYFVDNALQQSSLTGSPYHYHQGSCSCVITLQMKGSEDTIDSLMCHDCGMTSTLWVCLTCGYVGCGRYTRKHAAQHYSDERHPYSLELATGRIWDYDSGTFAHRKDLMECPVLSMTWGNADSPIRRQGSDYSSSSLVASSLTGRMDSYQGNSSLSQAEIMSDGRRKKLPANTTSKSSTPPKKSIMISLEYEALLQSALEDQSQHFEGEISRLRADFAASRLQDTQISDRESREIDALRKDCDRLKSEVEKLSSTLLDLQTDEAKHRATSQKLLRDQTISKDLLEKIRMDTTKELESSDEMFEDLQLQISDLTANIRMMQQIAVDDELNQAQIFGTTGGVKETKQRGKKSRRSNRKR